MHFSRFAVPGRLTPSPVFTNDLTYLTSTLSVNPGVSQEIIDSIKYTDTNETAVPRNCNFDLKLVLEGKNLICAMGSNCVEEYFSCDSKRTEGYAIDTFRIGKPKRLTIAEMGDCIARCPLVMDMCPCRGCPNKVNAYGKLIAYSKIGTKILYLIGTRYQCAGDYKNPLGTSVIRQPSGKLKNPVNLNRIIHGGRLYLHNKDVTGKLNPKD